MYESHFQFQRRPFSATPDAECVFITDSIREIIAEFVISTQRGQGISVLTGAAGMGKTLLCGRLADELSGQFQVALLKNANFATRRSLLQSLLFELGQSYSGMAEQELRLEFEKYCESILADCDGVALIIDEAHLLSQRLLEEIRCITNLTSGGMPLVRVVLSGQPSLEETLAQPAMAALNQRIASQHHLEPLSRLESQQYIEYRTNWGGANPQQIFTDEAIAAIAHAADGVPRALNQLCDHTLLLAFVSNQASADAALVDEALDDLRQLPLHWNERTRIAGPLDSLKKTKGVSAGCSTTEETAEPFDFDAFSSDGMESIEIGGTDVGPREETVEAVENADNIEYALADDDEVLAIDAAILDANDVWEMDALESDVENEEEPLMETDVMQNSQSSYKAGAIAGVVPLVDDHHTGPVMFEEEFVVDRYSALDADRRVRPALAADIPSPPMEPEIPAQPAAVHEIVVAEPTAESIEYSATDLDVLDDQAVSEDVGPSDDEVGAAILNDRLKTHRNVIDQINRLDFGGVGDIEASDCETGLDVVELEAPSPSQTLRHDRQPAPTGQTSSDDSENGAVPRPNLRRLFTKLRRVQHERTGR